MDLRVQDGCGGIVVGGTIVEDFISDPRGTISITSIINCCGSEFTAAQEYSGVSQEFLCHKFVDGEDIALEDYNFGAIVLVAEDGTETKYWLSGTTDVYYDMLSNGQATTNSDLATLFSNSALLDGKFEVTIDGGEINISALGIYGHKDTDSVYFQLEDRSDESVVNYDLVCQNNSYCRECETHKLTIDFNNGNVNPYSLVIVDQTTGNVELIPIYSEPIIDLSVTAPESAPDLETALNNLTPAPTDFDYVRNSDGSLTLFLTYPADYCILGMEMYGGSQDYQDNPFFSSDCVLIEYQNLIDLSGIDIDTGEKEMIITPDFYGDEEVLKDGVYQVNVEWDDGEFVQKDSGCTLVDCELVCKVAQRYLDDCDTLVSHLYERLKDSFICEDCECDNSCALLKRLYDEMNDDPDCQVIDTTIIREYKCESNIIVGSDGEWKRIVFDDFFGTILDVGYNLPSNSDEIVVTLEGIGELTEGEDNDYVVNYPSQVALTFAADGQRVVVRFKWYG